MNSDDLDLVETEDLVAALARRMNALLLVTLEDYQENDGADVCWYGGWVNAIGLARFAEDQILKSRQIPFKGER